MAARNLVVSAINFSEGGPLTVLRESLDAASATLGPEWTITALVHRKDLIAHPRVRTIEFPKSKSSWLRRMRYEWSGFAALSRRLNADLWVSLHDMTPRVQARRQVVYCHNPSPFYRPSLTEVRFDPRFILFNKFYALLYRVFIRRNYAVVVQQSWLREAFRRSTGHPHIVVAYPGSGAAPGKAGLLRGPEPGRPLRLLYPALPRVFKNIELLGEAVMRLPAEVAEQIDLRLTIDGSESRWAAELARRYGAVPGVSLIGRQGRDAMDAEYRACDAVLFPSRLETWGLPITEAKAFRKPLLVADLPYGHETVGDYDGVDFLPARDPQAWADAIAAMVRGEWQPRPHAAVPPEDPFVSDWASLWTYLIKGL